jgi:hypothetical protein
LEWEWHTPEEVGHENETAVEDRNNGEFLVSVIGRDLVSHFIETTQDRGLVVKDSGDVGDHAAT